MTVGALWTESSHPGAHSLQPYLCRVPPSPTSLDQESRAGGVQRGKQPAQSYQAEVVPGLELDPLSPSCTPCPGGDSSKPCFTFLFPPTLNHTEWVVRALLSSEVRVEGLRKAHTSESGLQTSQSSAPCCWHPREQSHGKAGNTS